MNMAQKTAVTPVLWLEVVLESAIENQRAERRRDPQRDLDDSGGPSG